MKPPDTAEVFESPVSTLWFDNDGILISHFRNTPRTVDKCKERLKLIKSLKKDKLLYSISEVSNSGTIDKEARDLFKAEFPHIYKALALVATTQMGKIIATLTTIIAPQSV